MAVLITVLRTMQRVDAGLCLSLGGHCQMLCGCVHVLTASFCVLQGCASSHFCAFFVFHGLCEDSAYMHLSVQGVRENQHCQYPDLGGSEVQHASVHAAWRAVERRPGASPRCSGSLLTCNSDVISIIVVQRSGAWCCQALASGQASCAFVEPAPKPSCTSECLYLTHARVACPCYARAPCACY